MRKVGSSSRILCASPAYIAGRGMPNTPDELAGHDCLTYRFDLTRPAWRFRSPAGLALVQVKTKVQSDDGEALRLLALHGSGIALLPFWSVAPDIQAKRLIQLLPEFEVAPTDAPFGYSIFALFQPTRQHSPKLRAFIDFLAQSIKERERAAWQRTDE